MQPGAWFSAKRVEVGLACDRYEQHAASCPVCASRSGSFCADGAALLDVAMYGLSDYRRELKAVADDAANIGDEQARYLWNAQLEEG